MCTGIIQVAHSFPRKHGDATLFLRDNLQNCGTSYGTPSHVPVYSKHNNSVVPPACTIGYADKSTWCSSFSSLMSAVLGVVRKLVFTTQEAYLGICSYKAQIQGRVVVLHAVHRKKAAKLFNCRGYCLYLRTPHISCPNTHKFCSRGLGGTIL